MDDDVVKPQEAAVPAVFQIIEEQVFFPQVLHNRIVRLWALLDQVLTAVRWPGKKEEDD